MCQTQFSQLAPVYKKMMGNDSPVICLRLYNIYLFCLLPCVVFAVGQQLPDEVLMVADYQVASDQKVEQDFDSSLAQCEEAASPLSKLEEMKRLLPAVEMKGLKFDFSVCFFGNPPTKF